MGRFVIALLLGSFSFAQEKPQEKPTPDCAKMASAIVKAAIAQSHGAMLNENTKYETTYFSHSPKWETIVIKATGISDQDDEAYLEYQVQLRNSKTEKCYDISSMVLVGY